MRTFLAGDGQMKCCRIAIAILSTIVAVAARAEERLPTIPPAQYTEEQKQAAVDFESARKVPVFGPFEPLMYSPQVMSQARAMGDYLRYKSAIGNTLSELVILITAREWTQDYEWAVHYQNNSSFAGAELAILTVESLIRRLWRRRVPIPPKSAPTSCSRNPLMPNALRIFRSNWWDVVLV
jgi:hypothetical protein